MPLSQDEMAAAAHEYAARERTPGEKLRFHELLQAQMAVAAARGLLLEAQFRLDAAREAIDRPETAVTSPPRTLRAHIAAWTAAWRRGKGKP